MRFESEINGNVLEVELDESQSTAVIDGEEVPYQIISKETGRFLLKSGTKMYRIDNITTENKNVIFSINGTFLTAKVKDDQDLLLERLGFKAELEASIGSLKAPMPGKILEILVNPGDTVSLGDPVLILEAMKMENELKAPADGVVESLNASAGDNVEKNQLLLEITPRG